MKNEQNKNAQRGRPMWVERAQASLSNRDVGGYALRPRRCYRHSNVDRVDEVCEGQVESVDLDMLSVNTIRGLCMDMVQRADSGHPGTPMDIAPVAYTLWQRFLRFDPRDPIWPNRDRFVLSEGHASTLLWSLLHLSGVRAVDPEYEVLGELAVAMEDLKTFRELGSKCPGHPEYRWTSGVEATTGPLGQGVATSVGMALAGRWLATHYNRDDFPIFDFDVYALAGDGCMMEGVSSEAASLAAHQRLSNLCWIYDSNRVTIEGHTDLSFTEDVAGRFLSYGWNVVTVADANDLDLIERAFHSFKAEYNRPTLILVHSHIGYGSPVEDSPKAHGEPFGVEGVRSTKRFFGLPEDEEFHVPDSVYAAFKDGIALRGEKTRTLWQEMLERYGEAYPDLAIELDQIQRRELPEGWDEKFPAFEADPVGIASRVSSGRVLNAFAQKVPWVIGGTSDLAPSTLTRLVFEGAGDQQADEPGGRNFHFGIREHASAAVANGMALTKVRPFWSTFFIFSDYARPSIRLSALMEIPVIHIFTHDSIGVGQDGPTHQPIEQLASLRAIPGLLVFRPADANEVVASWRVVGKLKREPAVMVLTRQNLPTLDRTRMAPADGLERGAYVLLDPENGTPEILLLATGSEVHLALAAHDELVGEGILVRVVSMPCWELFERQPKEYRDTVLPPKVRARVAIEQASTFGWERYVGDQGAVVGMHTFGASAPLKELLTKFGFTRDRIANVAASDIGHNERRAMKATQQLHEQGESLWLDNITRAMLDKGQIQRYVEEYSVTGLTSNPSIFDAAITTGDYNDSIQELSKKGLSSEEIFFEIAIADLRRAADLFAPAHERTNGVDGWVSLEVSPLLAYDTEKTTETAKWIHEKADRANLFVKIPGTPEGLPAIEESIANGVPINVTLLFDVDQYRAAADAYLRGVERRIAAGLNPAVDCVASLFISRWDTAVAQSVPNELQNGLGLAIGRQTYGAYREMLDSPRFQRAANFGARAQRLLWASTKTKDPKASDTLYISNLFAPFTINTMPDATLEAFYDHGEVGEALAEDGGDYAAELERFEQAGVDVKALAHKLQSDGAQSFVDAWTDLIAKIDEQLKALS